MFTERLLPAAGEAVTGEIAGNVTGCDFQSPKVLRKASSIAGFSKSPVTPRMRPLGVKYCR